MKITQIKSQVKRTDRYSIYVDEKYTFSLSESELLNLGLRIGQEFTESELEEVQRKAVADKAFDRVLNLIIRRPRSEWEIRDYLKRKDYEQTIAEATVSRLYERGYLDDKDFAKRWVDSRRLLKNLSKLRLRQELSQKRIKPELIDEVLSGEEIDDLDSLRELIVKKKQQTKYQDDIKLMQYLARQGFGYGDIKTVLGELSEDK